MSQPITQISIAVLTIAAAAGICVTRGDRALGLWIIAIAGLVWQIVKY